MEAERQLHPRHQAGRDEPAGAAGPEAAAAASSRDGDLSGGREEGRCDQLSRVLQVRRELYAQCFDELIRQSTINCTERGLLLLRVRDELRMTLHAYQTLYESSIAFGIRKALQAEQGKTDMENYIAKLEEEKAALEKEVDLM